MARIVKHEERNENETGYTRTIHGGVNDGQEFRMVKAHMDNGSILWLWMCNTNEGYFKQVFVPWDFDHPKIV
jgi:hypothetical protein